MAYRNMFPEKILTYSQEETTRTEELPILLDHLHAYIAGIRETSEIGKIKPGEAQAINDLMRRAREAARQIQGALRAKGWKLEPDAKTWVSP